MEENKLETQKGNNASKDYKEQNKKYFKSRPKEKKNDSIPNQKGRYNKKGDGQNPNNDKSKPYNKNYNNKDTQQSNVDLKKKC